VIPDALDRNVRFEEGRGPLMTPIGADEIVSLDGSGLLDHLAPVLETVSRVRRELPDPVALLGFCGAPWTVATYMIAGHGTPDQAPARLFGYRHPEAFDRLLDLLADLSAEYLCAQLEAGADAVQIFDSWAGVLGEREFERYCIKPVAKIVARVKQRHPGSRIIAFAKGAGLQLRDYRARTGADALGLDWSLPLSFCRELQVDGPVQGNLDPMRVVAGGQALDDGVDAILRTLGRGPLIFNLGHGITPEADPDHVRHLVDRIRSSGIQDIAR
jgi:uroporphyrinogen decarboxylase